VLRELARSSAKAMVSKLCHDGDRKIDTIGLIVSMANITGVI